MAPQILIEKLAELCSTREDVVSLCQRRPKELPEEEVPVGKGGRNLWYEIVSNSDKGGRLRFWILVDIAKEKFPHDPTLKAAEENGFSTQDQSDVTQVSIDIVSLAETQEIIRRAKRVSEIPACFWEAPDIKNSFIGRGMHGIPAKSALFVGRTKLFAQLRQDLLDERATYSISVEGLPGIGKTELAIQLAYDTAEAFPGGVYWVHAESGDLTNSWSHLASDLNILDGTPKEKAIAVINTIKRSHLRTLVIIDNAESWPLEPRPDGANVRYLITTRRLGLANNLLVHQEVAPLEQSSALALLEKVSEQSIAPTDKLIEALDGHVIAILVAGAYMRHFKFSPAKYLESWSKNPWIGEESDTGNNRIAMHAFETLWDKLAPDAQEAWSKAAVFAPAPVSTELADAITLSSIQRAKLRAYHLIRDHDDGSWSLHRLAIEFARHRALVFTPKIEAAFPKLCAKHVVGMNQQALHKLYNNNGAHLERALSIAVKLGDTASGSILRKEIATALYAGGQQDRAQLLFREELMFARQTENPPGELVSRLLSNLSISLIRSGSPDNLQEARTFLDEALDIRTATFGADSPRTASVFANKGFLLLSTGELKDACYVLECALQAMTTDMKELRVATLSNLGAAYRLRGDLNTAQEYLKSALTTGSTNLSTTKVELALVFEKIRGPHNLPNLRLAEGLLEEALSNSRLYFAADDRWVTKVEGILKRVQGALVRPPEVTGPAGPRLEDNFR